MKIDNQQLGSVIKRIRKRRGLTQRALAESIGVTVNYVSMLERGDRSTRVETLNAIADELAVPASFLTLLGSVPTKSNASPNMLALLDSTNAAMNALIDSEGE